MNIFISSAKHDKLVLCLQNTDELLPGQTEFHPESCQDQNLFDHHELVCTQTVFNTLKPIVGGLQSPALIADALATPVAGRVNVYIQNGSLKIVS